MIHAHAAAGKNTNIAMAVKAGFDRRVASVPLMRNGKSGMRESEAAYAKQKAAQLVKAFCARTNGKHDAKRFVSRLAE